MVSIREIAIAEGIYCLRELTARYGVACVREMIEARSMADFHRRTGGAFGPLGPAIDIVRKSHGGFRQDYQLGVLNHVPGETIHGESSYMAEVTLAAVRCFGTEDSTTDQLYVVMSVATVNPNDPGLSVKTQRTSIQDVEKGDTTFKNAIRLEQEISGTSGIMVHLAIIDHESGDQDDIRDQINRILQDGVTKAASALSGGDLAGTVGDITNFEVGGVKPFQILTLGLAGVLAGAVKDDVIGEHTYVIPPGHIIDLANPDNYARSIRPPEGLDFDVQFNWPPHFKDEFVFTNGSGTYKAYLNIKGVKKTKPINPNLP